jgi:hypothetical protein
MVGIGKFRAHKVDFSHPAYASLADLRPLPGCQESRVQSYRKVRERESPLALVVGVAQEFSPITCKVGSFKEQYWPIWDAIQPP